MREHILTRSHLPAQHAKRHLHHQMVCYELLRPLSYSKFDKTFTMSNVLKQDERTGTGEKSFNCSACDKTFTSSNRLADNSVLQHLTRKSVQCFELQEATLTQGEVMCWVCNT